MTGWAGTVRSYGDALAVVTVVRPGDPVPSARWFRAPLLPAGARAVIADSGTGDPALDATGPEVVRVGEDAGYAAAANRAVAALPIDVGWVALVAPGTAPPSGTPLKLLLAAAARWPRAGALGPAGSAAPPTGLRAALRLLLRSAPWPPAPARAPAVEGPVGRLHGGIVVLRRAALDSVDGFDPRYAALADLDLADRLARAGWQCVQVPGVAVPPRGPRPDPTAVRRDAHRYLAERNPSFLLRCG